MNQDKEEFYSHMLRGQKETEEIISESYDQNNICPSQLAQLQEQQLIARVLMDMRSSIDEVHYSKICSGEIVTFIRATKFARRKGKTLTHTGES